jgi:hypothetical protein
MAKSISDTNVDLYMCAAHFKPEYLQLVSDKGNTFKLKALDEESIALPSRTVTSKQKIPVSATPSVRAAERSVELNPNSSPHKRLKVLVQYSKEMERHASIVSGKLDDLMRKHNQLKKGRTASPHATPMDVDYEPMLATPARTVEDKGVYSTSLPNADSTSLPNSSSTSFPDSASFFSPRSEDGRFRPKTDSHFSDTPKDFSDGSAPTSSVLLQPYVSIRDIYNYKIEHNLGPRAKILEEKIQATRPIQQSWVKHICHAFPKHEELLLLLPHNPALVCLAGHAESMVEQQTKKTGKDGASDQRRREHRIVARELQSMLDYVDMCVQDGTGKTLQRECMTLQMKCKGMDCRGGMHAPLGSTTWIGDSMTVKDFQNRCQVCVTNLLF